MKSKHADSKLQRKNQVIEIQHIDEQEEMEYMTTNSKYI